MAFSKITTRGMSGDTLEAGDIAANAVGASELADNAVDTAAIADLSVTNAKLPSNIIPVKPHIQYGILQPAIAGKDLSGTALGGSYTYGTAHTDGHSYYYTDIKGSKPIKDPRIGAHFGSQRHRASSIQLLEQETATHGDTVYSIDGREWWRAVGDQVAVHNNANGHNVGLNSNDNFWEITFYGIDLNWAMGHHSTNRGFVISVDGGTESAEKTPAETTMSGDNNPKFSRYVDSHILINVGVGATLGIHTVKIRPHSTGTNEIACSFLEIITQDTTSTTTKSQIQIPAQNVVSYGKKFAVSASALHYNPFAFKTDGSTAWASGAHNGTSWPVGTGSSHNIDTATSLGLSKWLHSSNYYKPYNGGRVVIWVDSSGNIKTSVTVMPPNAKSYADSASPSGAGTTKANAAAANDTSLPTFEVNAGGATDVDEDGLSEVATTFYNREFGNGAANGGTGATHADFSMATDNTADEMAYVMDDGLTSLYGDIRCADQTKPMQDATGNSTHWTFIGTGVSMQNSDVTADINFAQSLPYGTHVVRYLRDGTTSNSTMHLDGTTVWTGWSRWAEITIHQPKRPPIPEDAVVLADYMLMADFVKTGVSGFDGMSKGARKISLTREVFMDSSAALGANIEINAYFTYFLRAGTSGSAKVTTKLPAFASEVTWQGEMGTASIDSSENSWGGNAITLAQASGGTASTEVLTYSSGTKPELGMNNFQHLTQSGGYRTNAMEIATPIHTSSHYQSFETPFLKELIGGDRNMEQTNLVVTSDGKSWDEVTRDTSYLGNTVLQISSGDGEVTNTTLVIMTDCRGFSPDTSKHIHMIQKDFAIAHDRQICLRDGEYEINLGTICISSSNRQECWLKINGDIVFQIYNANGGWAKGHSTGELQLKRGDYIQILGGYWGNNDAKHTEYHIKRLN